MKKILIKETFNVNNFKLWVKNNTKKICALSIIVISISIFYLDQNNNITVLSIKNNVLNNSIKLSMKVYLHYKDYLSLLNTSLLNHKNLILENKELKKQNLLLMKNQVLINRLNIENANLKSLVNFLSQNKQIEYISTRILKLTNDFNTYAVIPLGYKHGIQSDQAVITDKGLIGKIINVNEEFSHVLLITDRRFRIPVKVLDSNIEGIARGHNTDHLKLLYVKEEHVLHNDMVLVTSGNTTIPEGIYIGYLQDKDKVITNLNFKNIDFVSVIKIKPTITKYASKNNS